MGSLSVLQNYLSIITRLKLKEIYLIGGSVRDILLKRVLRDIDIAVPSDSIEIAKKFADRIGGSFFVMSEKEGIARVVKKEGRKTLQFDFAMFKGKDIIEDLSNRDFTINAMAIQISKFRISDFGFRISSIEIIDPYNGSKDLKDKIVRIVKPNAFSDDPLRMLRAIRLASDFDFKIEDKTIENIKSFTPSLNAVSSERVRDELFKIFKNPKSHYYIFLLDEYGLLDVVIPEIKDMKGLKQGSYHVYELWTHSLKTVEYLEDVIRDIKLYLPEYSNRIKRHLKVEIEQGIDRLGLLKFAALLHDTGKPSTIKTDEGKISFYQHWIVGAEINKGVCRRLKISTKSEEIVRRITENHMRPLYLTQLYNPPFPPLVKGGRGDLFSKGEKEGFITRRAMYRFFRDASDSGIDVLLLSIADAMATQPKPSASESVSYKTVAKVVKRILDYYYAEYKRHRKKPLISGSYLIKRFKVKPGPVIGRILKDVEEHRGAGLLKNKSDAINYIKENLHKYIVSSPNR